MAFDYALRAKPELSLRRQRRPFAPLRIDPAICVGVSARGTMRSPSCIERPQLNWIVQRFLQFLLLLNCPIDEVGLRLLNAELLELRGHLATVVSRVVDDVS